MDDDISKPPELAHDTSMVKPLDNFDSAQQGWTGSAKYDLTPSVMPQIATYGQREVGVADPLTDFEWLFAPNIMDSMPWDYTSTLDADNIRITTNTFPTSRAPITDSISPQVHEELASTHKVVGLQPVEAQPYSYAMQPQGTCYPQDQFDDDYQAMQASVDKTLAELECGLKPAYEEPAALESPDNDYALPDLPVDADFDIDMLPASYVNELQAQNNRPPTNADLAVQNMPQSRQEVHKHARYNRRKACEPCRKGKRKCNRLDRPNLICSQCEKEQETISTLNFLGKSMAVFVPELCCLPYESKAYEEFKAIQSAEHNTATKSGEGWQGEVIEARRKRDAEKQKNIGRTYKSIFHHEPNAATG